MKISLTDGMFGEKLYEISHCDKYEDISEIISTWKKQNYDKYRICPYMIFTIRGDSIAVDFGDYRTFILIEDIPENIMEKLT